MIPHLPECWKNARPLVLDYLAGPDSQDLGDTLYLRGYGVPNESIQFLNNTVENWRIESIPTGLHVRSGSTTYIFMPPEKQAVEFYTDVNVVSSSDSEAAISGDAATNRQVGIYTAGNLRSLLKANDTAESGSNAGSNLVFETYNDAGDTLLHTPITIYRSTGGVQLGSTAVGFFNATPGAKPTVTGARNSPLAAGALFRVLTELQTLGLIVNSTTQT